MRQALSDMADERVDGLSFWEGFEAGQESRDQKYGAVLQALEVWWAGNSSIGEYLPTTALDLCREYERIRSDRLVGRTS